MIPSAAWRYWRLNDPFCSERHSNAAATPAAKIANAFEWFGQPPKIALSPLEICTPIWYIVGPTWVPTPNGIWIGSDVFAGLTNVTNRQTDRQSKRPTDQPRDKPLSRDVMLPTKQHPRGTGLPPFLPFFSLVHSIPHLLLCLLFPFFLFLFALPIFFFCPSLSFIS